MSARRSYILVIFCFISTIYSYGQSAGIAANFGIDSSIYSGSPDIDVDDWLTEVMPKEHGNISPKDLGLLPITDDI